MTAVRVRHELDADSKFFADVPFSELDTVIPIINKWGVNGETPTLSGQICYDATEGAYFEIVIHEDEA